MKARVLVTMLVCVLCAPVLVSAETPTSGEIVARMIDAAGGEEFPALGVLKLDVTEDETRNDGTTRKRAYTLYIDTQDFGASRMEMAGSVVIACRALTRCWATRSGVLDDKPQTPQMARLTLNQTAFPLLLPFSLRMEGVYIEDEVRELEWEGRKAWALTLPFSKGFFVSPFMSATWVVVVAQDDYSMLTAHFLPPPEFKRSTPRECAIACSRPTT